MRLLATLDLPSLSPGFLAFFASHGILSVEDFLMYDIYQLPGLRAPDSDTLREVITEVLGFLDDGYGSWRSGWDLFNNLEQNVKFLSTGSDSLDSLLQGGLREGTVTELVGASSSGKTQLCMQASAYIAFRFGARVAYIDTSNSFSSERLEQILDDLDSHEEERKTGALMEALKKIACYWAFDACSMLTLLQALDSSIKNHRQEMDGGRLRLIVVDSVSSVISPVLGGNTLQGHTLMMSIGQILKKLAVDNGIAVLITNHTVTGQSGALKPALGESWKSVPHVRLLLRHDASDGKITASVMKHSCLATGMKEAVFSFARCGLQPVVHHE